MVPYQAVYIRIGLCCLLMAGCSAHVPPETHRHQGAKINLADFATNTIAYKGKTITLVLKVDDSDATRNGQSKGSFAGRDVRFTAAGPNGQQLKIIITVPPGLMVPDAETSNEWRVTFTCTRGSLRQGNEAKEFAKP